MRGMRRRVPGPRLLLTAALLGGAALLASPAAGAAQTLADYDYDHLTFRGVGLGGGYLWSGRVENTELYTLRIDLGYLGPGIRMVPSFGYWASELQREEIDSLAGQLQIPSSRLGTIEWSDISFSVDTHLVWTAPLGIFTFIGAGLGLHALNGQGPAVEGTFVEDLMDDFTVGVNGIAGFEFEPIRRVRVFAEGRYTALNSLRYASARGGVQIMFSYGDAQVGVAPAPPAPPAPGRAP